MSRLQSVVMFSSSLIKSARGIYACVSRALRFGKAPRVLYPFSSSAFFRAAGFILSMSIICFRPSEYSKPDCQMEYADCIPSKFEYAESRTGWGPAFLINCGIGLFEQLSIIISRTCSIISSSSVSSPSSSIVWIAIEWSFVSQLSKISSLAYHVSIIFCSSSVSSLSL